MRPARSGRRSTWPRPTSGCAIPVLYRIRHAEHHHTGDTWCIYPMYDFAHCLSDYIEGITHSICTLEFEVHRPLYDWILESAGSAPPAAPPVRIRTADPDLHGHEQAEAASSSSTRAASPAGTIPRMPTICGLRRRGVPASALRRLRHSVGVTNTIRLTDIAVFEHAIRDELNACALRRFGVLRPVK